MRFVRAVWKLLVGIKDALVLLFMLIFFGLLDDHPVEVEGKHALAGRRGTRGQEAVDQGEEQQHEDQDQHVLDPDQYLPDDPGEPHSSSPKSVQQQIGRRRVQG